MGEEQTKILEMLSSGEITVDEAAKLLDALGERPEQKHANVRVEAAPGHFELPDVPDLPDLPGREILGAISQAISADTFGKLRRAQRVRRPVRVPRARTVDQIMSFASMGVSPEYARAIKAVLPDVTGDDLVTLSSMKVSTDYLEDLKEAFGGDISVDDVVGLSSMKVKPDYVEELKEAFGRDVDLGEIMSLASMKVRPDYIEEIKEAFGGEVDLDDVVSLASMHVKPDYIEEIRDALGDVSVHDIIGLSSLGVSAKYIEDLVEAGVEGLSVEDVIRSTREEKTSEE